MTHPKDPRAQSAKWRSETAIALYKRRVLTSAEAINRLAAEGLPSRYAGALLAASDLAAQCRRDLRNARRRELYAQRKAAKL